jgi:hypothetical protein
MPAKLDCVKNVNCFSRADESSVPTILQVLGVALFLAFSSTSASPQSQQEALRGKSAIKGSDGVEHGADVVEQIYVARSTHTSTTVPATAFCDKAPFKAVREAYGTWSSVETRAEDGRLSNPAVKTIGDMRACFGSSGGTRDLLSVDAYSEGTIAGVPFKGIGSCQIQANFPETGISQGRCFQALSGLPSEYVGGVILNNGIASQKENGDVSSPPGYLQSGIATFRLWKKRR